MDELGPLNIEFIINNPEVIAQAKEVEATLQGVTASVAASAAQATASIAGTIERLEAELLQLEIRKSKTLDPYLINSLNRQMNDAGRELTRLYAEADKLTTPLSNVGNTVEAVVPKMGKFEAAVNRVTDAGNIGARVVTMLSRQIIGLGVGLLSGIIGAKAIEALVQYISNLDIFKDKVTEAKLKQDDLNKALAGGEYSGAIEKIQQLTTDIQLAKEGFLDKTKVLHEYNNELGSSLGYASNLDQAEQLIVKHGNAYIQVTLLKAAANLALQDAAKKAYEAAQVEAKPLTDFSGLSTFAAGQS